MYWDSPKLWDIRATLNPIKITDMEKKGIKDNVESKCFGKKTVPFGGFV